MKLAKFARKKHARPDCLDHLGHRSMPLSPWLVVFLLAVSLLVTGCTRRFFRQRADNDVESLLAEKADVEHWPLLNYWIYPHPYARFADLTGNPDRPPMPIDDPAAWLLSPRPQKPKQIGDFDGTGYLDVIEQFDAANRALLKMEGAETPDMVRSNREPAAARPPLPPQETQANALPTNRWHRDQPYLLNLDQCLELAIFNSREFQNQRENLYLSALPVTLQRFNFLPQFLATENAVREWSTRPFPGGPTNQGTLNTNVGAQKLFSTGALLILRVANQTVIDFTSNGKPTLSQSTALLDLTQPLLQGGGRAVTLEPLTQSERDLLYEVRRFNRFNREFYVNLVGGQQLSLGGGGGALANLADLNLGVSGRAANVGYLPTLRTLASVRVEQQNVESLEGLYRFFLAYAEGGGFSKLQVDQVEQDLNSARLRLLSQRIAYLDNLDQFKLQLGLPTDLPFELDFSPLKPLADQMSRFQLLENQFREVLVQLEKEEANPEAPKRLRSIMEGLIQSSALTEATAFRANIPGRWSYWKFLNSAEVLIAGRMGSILAQPLYAFTPGSALMVVNMVIPRRVQLLHELELRRQERNRLLDEQEIAESEEKPFPEEKQLRLAELSQEIDIAEMELTLSLFERETFRDPANPGREKILRSDLFRRIVYRFALLLEESRVERLKQLEKAWPELPPVRINDVDLFQVSLEEAQHLAGETALNNRLDLMNTRAQVADAWRKIAVFANSLLGGLDLRYNVNVLTPPAELGQPLNFKGQIARHQLTLNAELPLVRRLERNSYRASLIAFQRQRRNLQATEDQILFQVRQQVRQLRQLAEQYKIQQRNLQLAFYQVDNALEVLRAPPAAGETRDAATAAAALTQQLLQAQRSLPQAQNGLYQTWVNYQVTRMNLYRDLELLQIDGRGAWINELQPDQPRRNGSPDRP